jgi:hypothetical protein
MRRSVVFFTNPQTQTGFVGAVGGKAVELGAIFMPLGKMIQERAHGLDSEPLELPHPVGWQKIEFGERRLPESRTLNLRLGPEATIAESFRPL